MRRKRIAAPLVIVVVLVAIVLGYALNAKRAPAPTTPEGEDFAQARRELVDKFIGGQAAHDTRVIAAMLTVPRHEFVPAEYILQAYQDRVFPIGEGQTISQPSLVAEMTELLEVAPGEKVLEVGTGSGYQAAILADLTDQVYSIEIIESLSASATQRLRRLGYDRIQTKVGDGYFGWEEYAPYDAIIVTCAPDHIPKPLVDQLKPGGKMVIPVGPPGSFQDLWLLEKAADGTVTTREMGRVTFVPMTGTAQRD